MTSVPFVLWFIDTNYQTVEKIEARAPGYEDGPDYAEEMANTAKRLAAEGRVGIIVDPDAGAAWLVPSYMSQRQGGNVYERKFTVEVMVTVNDDGSTEIGYQVALSADREVEPTLDPINPDLVDLLGDHETEYLDSTVVGDYGDVTLLDIYQEVEQFVEAARKRQ